MKIIGRCTCLFIFSAVCWIPQLFMHFVSDRLWLPVTILLSAVLGIAGWWFGRRYDRMQHMSERDVLTNLFSRRFVFEVFPKLLHRVAAEKQQLSVLLVDADNLKILNDELGHLVGDEAIRHLANVLLSNTRVTDVVARIGGDEFFIIAPYTDKDSALKMVERIEQELVRTSAGLQYYLTASIGTATYPVDAETLDGLFIVSDTNMYKKKQNKPQRVLKTS